MAHLAMGSYLRLLPIAAIADEIQLVVNGIDEEEKELLSIVLIGAGILSIEIADDRLEVVEELRGRIRRVVPEGLKDLRD